MSARHSLRRTGVAIAVLGVVVVSCNAVASNDPPAVVVMPEPAIIELSTTTTATSTTAATSNEPLPVAPAPPPAPPSTAAASTSTNTTSTTVAEPSAVDADVPTPDTRVPTPDELVDDDDPSFELGPDVVLDVDLARFPPDDAGVGGAGGRDDSVDDVVDPDSVSGWAAVDAYLESVLIRPGNTAASVAVSIGGDVVHAAAFGERDPLSGDQTETVDRFRVASISKTITAITIMRLVEDGVVTLDEPIGARIAGHVGLESVSNRTQALTLRQLLTHRSGYSKYQSTFFRGGASDCADAARQGLSRGAGGGGYTYSNMNYCLAGQAIESLTGLDYEAAVYRLLLTPLGISGMRLAPTFDPGPDEVQHVTTPGRNYMETLGGAGSWIVSPTELVTIFDALDVSTNGFKPVPLARALEIITPSGGVLGQRGYGLGVISYGNGRFGHTGTIESTHAMLLNRGDGVTWAITVAGQFPGESTSLERIMNDAFAAGGFVAG